MRDRQVLLRAHSSLHRWGRVIVKDKLLNEGIPKYFKPHPPVEVKGQTPSTGVQHTAQDVPPAEPHKNSHAKDQDPSTGVQNLTDKAADLSISTIEPTRIKQIKKDEIGVRRSPRIRAKRVRSVMDEVREISVLTIL